MDVKTALRILWTDKATISVYRDVKRENKSTGQKEVDILVNEPCKLSFANLKPVNQTDSTNLIVQSAKLFIDENIVIPAGSKITVTRQTGSVFKFKQSGKAGVFENHQEIPLVPYEDYA